MKLSTYDIASAAFTMWIAMDDESMSADSTIFL